MHPILGDRRRLVLHLLAQTLVGAVLALLLRMLLSVPWWPSAAFALPLALIAAPVSLSAWYVCRAMPLDRTSALRVTVTALVAALVTASLWAAAGRIWWGVLVRLDVADSAASATALTSLVVGLGALAYLLSVTVRGEPDRRSGRLLPPELLDRAVRERVLEPLAGRDVDALLLLLDVRHSKRCRDRTVGLGAA